MLHVHLLAAPDFLGFDSAIEMAQKGFKPQVERGLRLKRVGNDLMARDRRPRDPPGLADGRRLQPRRDRARAPRVRGTARGRARRDPRGGRLRRAARACPTFPRDAELVSMVNPREYPMNVGDMASTRGRALDAPRPTRTSTEEMHVAHSNALHSVFTDTRTPYFVGPLARIQPERGDPHAGGARGRGARRARRSAPNLDPFMSMAARVAETALALEEALRLIRAYEPPDPPHVEVHAARRPGHVDAPRRRAARSTTATTWTTTARSSRRRSSRPRRRTSATWSTTCGSSSRACSTARTRSSRASREMVVRNYDPCISCATHFLRLDVERGVRRPVTARVRVIGCGNPEAGDDAVGPARGRAARADACPPDVEVVEARTGAAGARPARGRGRRRDRGRRAGAVGRRAIAGAMVRAVGGPRRAAGRAPRRALVARPRARRGRRARGRAGPAPARRVPGCGGRATSRGARPLAGGRGGAARARRRDRRRGRRARGVAVRGVPSA